MHCAGCAHRLSMWILRSLWDSDTCPAISATSAVFSKPSWTTYGQCRKDTFQAWSAGSPATPILCGTNSGYHSECCHYITLSLSAALDFFTDASDCTVLTKLVPHFRDKAKLDMRSGWMGEDIEQQELLAWLPCDIGPHIMRGHNHIKILPVWVYSPTKQSDWSTWSSQEECYTYK